MHEAKICIWNVTTEESFFLTVKMTNLEAHIRTFNCYILSFRCSLEMKTQQLCISSPSKKKDFINPFYFKYSLSFR